MVGKNVHHLIIAGTTKAATTSVFNYLSEHPQVAKSKYKEMRFFLGDDYPLEKNIQFGSIEDYHRNFENYSIEKTCVEATPDYLYSIASINKMTEVLSEFKLVFILRNPVNRFQSWYNFAKQNNSVADGLTLEEYFLLQKDVNSVGKPQYLMALEQGLYSNYLKVFFEKIGKDKICILFYEDIANDTKSQLKKIANFATIDESYYDNYKFQVSNKTIELKNPKIHAKVKNTKKIVKQLFANNDLIRKILRKIFRLVEPTYLLINKKKGSKINENNENVLYNLQEYYKDEKANIFLLTGINPPWK
jgi:Sulfotransferase domain